MSILFRQINQNFKHLFCLSLAVSLIGDFINRDDKAIKVL
ncbi:hypothetical protein BARBAKC583_0862 [Bartonella bacilliformis KC583]|uniref:Uncharacterized protein n=1 Tax=Bartonella bacilliformis (strain ATCC 35685 / KC583 / Herrer 020/F12,63) TaxID=360095 RepID=A1UT46_BARBK|nr:hypothetical protein BARBAKC583_0862 [Bartonella bacilliformis KC583]